MSRTDVEGSALWAWVEDHYRGTLVAPGPSEPREPAISADGSLVACTVSIRVDLVSAPRRAVLVVDGDRATRLIEHDDDVHRPRFAPVGDALAVLVGERAALVGADGLRPLADPGGVIEHLEWSPDGRRLLAVVADHGADAAGAQGSGRLTRARPEWAPHVMSDAPLGGWRRLSVLTPGDAEWRNVSPPGTTTWEATWCGADRVVAVQSPRPEEASWFDAAVFVIDASAGHRRIELTRPTAGQCVGLPAASPDGGRVAVVTATCSDRTVVAGDVTVLDPAIEGSPPPTRSVDLNGIDATWLGWRSDDVLVVAGQRGLETVVAEVDVVSGVVEQRWSSESSTCGQRYPEIALNRDGWLALVVEGFGVPPELTVLTPSTTASPLTVTELAHDGLVDAATAGRLDVVRWTAPDGLEIEGLLVRPHGPGPHPVVTYVHGGPVWAWRSRWSMGYPYTLALVRRGFAVFHPNPRGSSGRGEAFRAMVIGDLGGAESHDLLTGLDHLVATGLADPHRLGVLGGSHGGFMAAHLVTIDDRFAAAVSYCPVTHWPTMRLTTNDVAAQDRLIGPGAPSPVDAADSVATPTFVSTGRRDLITPASQGLMFHRALALRGVATQYVEYPLEGHGVRSFPAQTDFTTRLLEWFERWMPADGGDRR